MGRSASIIQCMSGKSFSIQTFAFLPQNIRYGAFAGVIVAFFSTILTGVVAFVQTALEDGESIFKWPWRNSSLPIYFLYLFFFFLIWLALSLYLTEKLIHRQDPLINTFGKLLNFCFSIIFYFMTTIFMSILFVAVEIIF